LFGSIASQDPSWHAASGAGVVDDGFKTGLPWIFLNLSRLELFWLELLLSWKRPTLSMLRSALPENTWGIMHPVGNVALLLGRWCLDRLALLCSVILNVSSAVFGKLVETFWNNTCSRINSGNLSSEVDSLTCFVIWVGKYSP